MSPRTIEPIVAPVHDALGVGTSIVAAKRDSAFREHLQRANRPTAAEPADVARGETSTDDADAQRTTAAPRPAAEAKPTSGESPQGGASPDEADEQVSATANASTDAASTDVTASVETADSRESEPDEVPHVDETTTAAALFGVAPTVVPPVVSIVVAAAEQPVVAESATPEEVSASVGAAANAKVRTNDAAIAQATDAKPVTVSEPSVTSTSANTVAAEDVAAELASEADDLAVDAPTFSSSADATTLPAVASAVEAASTAHDVTIATRHSTVAAPAEEDRREETADADAHANAANPVGADGMRIVQPPPSVQVAADAVVDKAAKVVAGAGDEKTKRDRDSAADESAKTDDAAAKSRVDSAPAPGASTRLPSLHSAAGVRGGEEPADSSSLTHAERNRLIARVARAVQTAHDRGGELKLRLSPPELGSLRLQVQMNDGVLTARIEAETREAQQIITDNLIVLRDRLAQQDIRVERLTVDLFNSGTGGGASTPQQGFEQRDGGGAAQRFGASSNRKPTPGAAPVPGVRSTMPNGAGGLNVVV